MKVRQDPSASLVADVDYSSGFEIPEDIKMTRQRLAILLIFLLGIAIFVYGISEHHWYIGISNRYAIGSIYM